MAELGLDASQETRITVMQLKIERLEEKQEEFGCPQFKPGAHI